MPTVCPFLRISDQVSYPYKTTCKITGMYIPVFTFLNKRQADNIGTGVKMSLG
jgi:hypothetical protein